MMTPNDVAQHTFTNARFNGYTMSEVDSFLDALTADYTTLYKESAILKAKMKVLVDKISEYRSTADDMRLALKSARDAAKKIIEDAEAQRAAMLAVAEEEVAERRRELRHEIENSEAQLEAARQSTMNFATGMRALVAQQQAYIDREVEFLDRLNEIKAEEAPEEQIPTPAPIDPDLEAYKSILEGDADLAALIAAAEENAEADPDAAYAQEVDGIDEPTRVVDLSTAAQEYNF